MGLLDLPGELLDEIITLTLPDGLESFVLSCKTVYVRAGTQIAYHNKLKEQWRYASTPSNDRGKALHILYQISRDPFVVEYIDTLSLYNVNSTDGSVSGASEEDFRMEDGNMERIEKLILECQHLQRAGVDVEEWWEKILVEDEQMDDEEDAEGPLCAIMTLLGQLPNLKTLQLPQRWQDYQPVEEAAGNDKELMYVFDSLIEYSNGHQNKSVPLQRLRTLLPFMPAGYDARAGLQCVEPFFSLKSLEEVFLTSCLAVNDDTYTGIPFKWRNPSIHSPIRRLELAHCCMDADGISALLAHTPRLEVFRYSHETKWHGCEHDWNPGAFIEEIGRASCRERVF